MFRRSNLKIFRIGDDRARNITQIDQDHNPLYDADHDADQAIVEITTRIAPLAAATFRVGEASDQRQAEQGHSALLASTRLLAREQRGSAYHNNNHHDIFEVAFSLEMPGCKNPLDWTDVDADIFYDTVERYNDVVLNSLTIDQPDTWLLHVFRRLDVQPGIRPTEFDCPLSIPFLINHPKVAELGGASRHSMSFIFIVEAIDPTKSVSEFPHYTVEGELCGEAIGSQKFTIVEPRSTTS